MVPTIWLHFRLHSNFFRIMSIFVLLQLLQNKIFYLKKMPCFIHSWRRADAQYIFRCNIIHSFSFLCINLVNLMPCYFIWLQIAIISYSLQHLIFPFASGLADNPHLMVYIQRIICWWTNEFCNWECLVISWNQKNNIIPYVCV